METHCSCGLLLVTKKEIEMESAHIAIRKTSRNIVICVE